MPGKKQRVLTITGARRVLVDQNTERTGDVVVVDGRISAEVAGAGEVLDAEGGIVTPGLINAHHHLLQSAFRTLPGTRGVPMREWLGVMASAYRAAGVDPELTGAAASVGLAESLLSGVTTVAAHHLTWPTGCDDVGMATAVVRSAQALGARLVFVRGSARDDPQEAAASATRIVESLLPEVNADGMLQLAVGPAGVHSDPRETFELLAQVAARFGLRRRTQANEQVDVEIALERYRRRPLDLLADWGWLEPDVTIAHLCDVTPQEIARLAAGGVTATHAPGCDVPMGWGVAPVSALLDAGIQVGLGTSGGGSNDAGHLLADARLAMQVSALAGPPLPARTAPTRSTPSWPVGRRRGRTCAPGSPSGSPTRRTAAPSSRTWCRGRR